MKLYKFAFFYRTFRKKSIKVLRLIFLISSILFSAFTFYNHSFPKITLFLFSIFLMVEIYYRFYIKKMLPVRKLSEGKAKNILEYFTIPALSYFYFDSSVKDLIGELSSNNSCSFLLEKVDIKPSELQIINIDKKVLSQKALDISEEVFGSYVTSVDLLTAYLILLNEKFNFYIKKRLKETDILNILYWTRFNFTAEEQPRNEKVNFSGEGIFDRITFGWTPFTKNFILDLTSKVIFEKPVVVGRRKEFQELIEILSKPEKNNVLLIGEVGSGKNSLIEAFAYDSFLGNIASKVNHKRVYQLMIGSLLAGTNSIADLEQRIEIVFEEIMHSGNIIIYIPDVENIFGSKTYHTNLESSLIPYLKNSHLPIIASVTTSAFKTYVQEQQNFLSFFEKINLFEPERNENIQMVLGKTIIIEKENNVIFTFKSVVSAVDLSKRFLSDKVLPGSAIGLLESVASSVSSAGRRIVEEEDVEKKVEIQTNVAVSAPNDDEKKLLLHLEEYLSIRIIGQDRAVKTISQALRRIRSGVLSNDKPISFLFLGPTGVGKTETAKALGEIYFKNKRNMVRLDMSEYKNSDALNRLLGSTPGEGDEKGELTEKVLDNPFSLILLDEFEKANPQVLDLFLQILEDGRLTDNKGKTVSFINTLIIATSNAGAIFINQKIKKDRSINEDFKKELLSEIEKENIFKIELINRFDDIIIFNPLTQDNIYTIATIYLNNFKEKLKQQDINFSFDSSVISYLASKGYDPEYGARSLRRLVEQEIEDALSKSMLSGSIKRGSSIAASINSNGEITLS